MVSRTKPTKRKTKLLGATPGARPAISKTLEGNQRTLKYGIYQSALSPSEEELMFEGLDLDNLEYEIKSTRIRLRRAMEAEAKQRALLESDDEKVRDRAATINRIVKGIGPDGEIFTRERIVKDFGPEVFRIGQQLLAFIEQRNKIARGVFNENDEFARAEARNRAETKLNALFTIASDQEMAEAKANVEKAKRKAGGD